MLKRLFLCFFLISSAAQSADLMDVYRQALENDPAFKASYSNYMSQREALPQAWSALLPQLNIDASAGRNHQEVRLISADVDQYYNGNRWQVSASQTIFNYQAWSQVQQARASVKAALADFNSAAQDLILRTSSAYLNLLLARDTLNFSEVKKQANKRQLDQAKQRFNVGLDPITSVYEAQAAYDQSNAQVIKSKNNLLNQAELLSKITNHLYDTISPLRDNKIPLLTPEPNNVDAWVATGLKQNYKLFAAKYGLQAARDNIKAKTSGNWPKFAIQGSSYTTHYDTGGDDSGGASGLANNIFVPLKQEVSNVSIVMNFPVFQGGLVASQTRQAKFDFQTSSERLEQMYREVVVNSRIAFNTIVDGISKVKADRQTVSSQQNSLDSVQAQYEAGTRTMTDVVLAQQRLFEAQEQLASDQYGLINAILNLKSLAGSLNVGDLQEVNAWLTTTRVDTLPPEYRERS